MRFLQSVLMASAVAFCAPNTKSTSPATPAARAFDSTAVHAIYLEGEFDEAAVILEKARQSAVLTHGDSTFIFKHLGVIYAAREETREKGKYFMYKLLATEPVANILDMYASDMIYMVFNHVKAEFEASLERESRGQKYKSKDSSQAAPNGNGISRAKPGHAGYWWFGGTVLVAAAAGVGVLLYYEEPPAPSVRKKTYGPD